MTSKGSPHAQFQRAIKQGNVLLALAVARELPPLSLENSFALLLLLAEKDPERFRYAAPRWHARFVLEAKRLDLAESRLALAAIEVLPGDLSRIGITVIDGLAQGRCVRLNAKVRPT